MRERHHGTVFTVELSNASGTVTKEDCGHTTSDGMGYTGQYTITGGTGASAGATGSGTFTIRGITQDSNAFTTAEIGTFNVPGAISAGTKRMFRT